MQMGRWFGFRSGYRDLVRLFVGRAEPDGRSGTIDLLEAFKATCRDEEGFRRELLRYSKEHDPRVRPEDIPPLVPSHMLPPTARNKMHGARVKSENLGGDWIERTLAPVESESIERNAQSFRELMRTADLHEVLLQVRVRGQNESVAAIVGALDSLRVSEALARYEWLEGQRPLERVLEFLKGTGERDPEIGRWWLVAPQPGIDAARWGPGERFGVHRRSRVSSTGRFGAYSGSDEREVMRFIAGVGEGDAENPETEALRDEHAAVLVFYPVVELNGPAAAKKRPADSEVTMGFSLQFPSNSKPRRVFWGVGERGEVS
jgi:hypothetical protein